MEAGGSVAAIMTFRNSRSVMVTARRADCIKMGFGRCGGTEVVGHHVDRPVFDPRITRGLP